MITNQPDISRGLLKQNELEKMHADLKNILSFRNKVAGLMHLDKDDLGQVNDVVYLPDGTRQIIELNKFIFKE